MSNSVYLYELYTNQQFVTLSYQTSHTLYYYPNLNFSNIFKFFKPPCHGQGSKNPLGPLANALYFPVANITIYLTLSIRRLFYPGYTQFHDLPPANFNSCHLRQFHYFRLISTYPEQSRVFLS